MAEPLTYKQVLGIVGAQLYTPADKMIEYVNRLGMTPAQYIEGLEEAKLFSPVYNNEGVVTGWNFKGNMQVTTTNPVNSNISQISRGTAKVPINTTIDATTQTIRTGKILPPSGAPSTWAYVANSVASPIIAAGVGISLGKTIDGILYNANPNFWDSHGMNSLNPATWSSLTTGVDYSDPVTGTAASLMNMIFGLNPETGETTAYIDENAYAYMAAWLNSVGVFAGSGEVPSTDIDISPYQTPLVFYDGNMFQGYYRYRNFYYWCTGLTSASVRIMATINNNAGFGLILASRSPFTYGWGYNITGNSQPNYPIPSLSNNASSATYNGQTYYYGIMGTATGGGYDAVTTYPTTPHYGELSDVALQKNLAAALLFDGVSGVEGIGTQPNATEPNTTGWSNYDNVLPSLQQQYPTVFDNPVQITTANPNGSTTTRNYVPIPLPIARGNTDVQPTSGTQTQQDIKAKPDVTPQPIIDLLTKVIQQPETEPFNPDPPVPPNPTETGEDEEPVTPMPTGNATALWSIYHPTQSQINSFGAWLWSSDFIEQLKKIFNNPMESIIGLHKVYATPIDAGTSTIVVGYLDSEVPSAYITQQYVTIDCGTVDINEDFGNVFDYSPYTVIKLYLPFVGIVELDPSEVMRSSINIKYGVDVLTGACLAKVRVKRDGNSATLYQYAGNCAVQYPLSMGSYMGIVASIVGVAGSVAATVASGGSAAPLALGALGAAFNAKTNVQNSGSFTGNAGAMGGKKPYLIIERPQTKIADNQQLFVGQPTNEYKRLGNYSGFIKCLDAHITNVNATDDELKEIQSYLISGVLV